MVEGLSFNVKEEFNRNCEGCAMGKQNRQPFPNKSQHRSGQPLELVHSDVNSVGSSRYFVTFIDDYSRYTTVYIIKHESEVLEKFKEFVELTENISGCRIKAQITKANMFLKSLHTIVRAEGLKRMIRYLIRLNRMEFQSA